MGKQRLSPEDMQDMLKFMLRLSRDNVLELFDMAQQVMLSMEEIANERHDNYSVASKQPLSLDAQGSYDVDLIDPNKLDTFQDVASSSSAAAPPVAAPAGATVATQTVMPAVNAQLYDDALEAWRTLESNLPGE